MRCWPYTVSEEAGEAKEGDDVLRRHLTLLALTALFAPAASSAPWPVVKTSSAAYDNRCAAAWQAVRFYRAKTAQHRARIGASSIPPVEQAADCRRLRERATYWKAAAAANARAVQREYADPPEPYLSIAKCETGYLNGGHPNWRHHNRTYGGAYGFAHSTWAAYRYAGYPARAADATPRQQTRVAMRLVARFGGYSSWPSCSIRLGLR